MVANDAPLMIRPPDSGGSPTISASHRITCRSRCSAAWLAPAQLGFAAAASRSARTPARSGGELTQPCQRGWPLPNGWVRTSAAISSSSAPMSHPSSGQLSSRHRAASSLATPGHVHRQVIDARPRQRIAKTVTAVAGVVDSVPGPQPVHHAVERQLELTGLDGNVLARTRRARIKGAGVHVRAEGRPHELELDAGKGRRQDPPLPSRRVPRDRLPVVRQQNYAVVPFGLHKTRDRRPQSGRDPVQREDRRRLLATLDPVDHAPADPAALGELVKRPATPFPLRPDTPTDPDQRKTSTHILDNNIHVHYSNREYGAGKPSDSMTVVRGCDVRRLILVVSGEPRLVVVDGHDPSQRMAIGFTGAPVPLTTFSGAAV